MKIFDFSLQGNYIDLIILVVLFYFMSEAFKYGFWIILADFFGFLFSLIFSLWGYMYVSQFLRSNFSLSHSLSNALGFLVTASLLESIIGFFLTKVVRKIPYKFFKKPWDNFAAVFPSLGQGLVLVSFILTLFVGFPVSPKIKSDIFSSKIGGKLVKETAGIESRLKDIFGGLIEDSLTYLTVKPESYESIAINVYEKKLSVDELSEKEMFSLVNQERKKVGLPELTWKIELVLVARAHAKDMWEREYFGHLSPEGEDVGDRLDEALISYQLAGENLALAPSLQTAHTGLMNSEGHRKNILNLEFKRIGIGVIDNGVFGKMFVQIFTD